MSYPSLGDLLTISLLQRLGLVCQQIKIMRTKDKYHFKIGKEAELILTRLPSSRTVTALHKAIDLAVTWLEEDNRTTQMREEIINKIAEEASTQRIDRRGRPRKHANNPSI